MVYRAARRVMDLFNIGEPDKIQVTISVDALSFIKLVHIDKRHMIGCIPYSRVETRE
jgi:hypothetical protein